MPSPLAYDMAFNYLPEPVRDTFCAALVSDLENLRFDITTLRGWFRNPATRILLVFFLSNLGSAIGTWVAGFRIFGALA